MCIPLYHHVYYVYIYTFKLLHKINILNFNDLQKIYSFQNANVCNFHVSTVYF